MADNRSAAPSSGWRISKACQECRKRKIKCNGASPCQTCQQRNTPCLYRDAIRQRRKKNQELRCDWGAAPEENVNRQHSPVGAAGRRNQSVMYTFHNSVSATHMASPSCKVQLYYGPTSHFSLMQHIYRDLVSTPHVLPSEPRGEVEEADAGLDLFSFRRIFFGTPAEAHDITRGHVGRDTSIMFLPYELASTFLERFLSTLYYLTPFQSKEVVQRNFEQLYSPNLSSHLDPSTQSSVLLALALGALGTKHYAWGDVLFERVKASCLALDDVVNLQTVQISLLMISLFSLIYHYAHYQTEQGRPNSSFLHLGTAARKALSAGLHKDAPSSEREGDIETIEERRMTFWSLYFYENWICFHLGRPSSLSSDDIGIAYPQDPFLLVLIHLSKAISRSAHEIYGKRHESLLQMWKVARSISEGLSSYDCRMEQAVGFGLEKGPQPGQLGVQQTILTILYYHTVLLTFRPFLIFRGRWQRDMKLSAQHPGSSAANRPTEFPTWLNEACSYVLYTARRTIHHLCEASALNELVRELRYHGFFLGSACFTLIYDFLQDETAAVTHLPWVHAALKCFSTMRPGDPITSTISALQTVLKKINPAYEWVPDQQTNDGCGLPRDPSLPSRRTTDQVDNNLPNLIPNSSLGEMISGLGPRVLHVPNNGIMQDDSQRDDNSAGSGDDMLDLTQSDMGWDFDFSTMDLEAFFSIYPTINQPPS